MRTVISIEREINLREAVLNYFFNLFPLREEAAGNPRDLAPVAFEQLFKSVFVAICGRRHQRIICRFVGGKQASPSFSEELIFKS